MEKVATDWRDLESRVFMQTGKRQPPVLVRGEGSRVWDEDGKAYVDFFAGVAVTSLGHSDPGLAAVLADQAATLIQVSNVFYTVPQLQLAELLVNNSCLDRVYFSNSGAEANEAAIKLARKWGGLKKNGAFEIITALDSFHGRTLTTITASGTDAYKDPFAPLPPGFVHVPYNDVDALRSAITDDTCAVLLEPIQGEGGVNVPDDGYLPAVRRLCDERNVLLILDEVQTGIGRCGALFAYELAGIEPDIMTLAKGIASGVPLGAVLSKEHCSVFEPGDHGSTYGGNPLACRAGYEVVSRIIDECIPEKVAEDAQHVEQRLHSMEDRFEIVSGHRGKGLLWAVALSRVEAPAVVAKCLGKGLIVNNVRPDAVRLCPALNISRENLDEGLDILEGVLAEVSNG
ncbi:MAG: aspartate aminotransferase family protein [Chloroflexi bacterium]|nr:aspartate aminotransferase family protein [Chloroflexota bacterium]